MPAFVLSAERRKRKNKYIAALTHGIFKLKSEVNMYVEVLHNAPQTSGNPREAELERRVISLERQLTDALNAIRCNEWMLGEMQQRLDAEIEKRSLLVRN